MTGKNDTDKKVAGKSAAGTQEPETSADDLQEPKPPVIDRIGDNQDTATTEIKTVEDLEACYPQLVTEIRDEVIKQIESCTAGQAKKNLPKLYERIVAELQSKRGPNLNVPGFLLEIDDPVAFGTLRAFKRLTGNDGLSLPCVLPYKNKATKAAMENYILRADGCGDRKRAEAGRAAMKRIK